MSIDDTSVQGMDLTAIRRMLVGKEGTMCSLRLLRDGISFAVHLIREQPSQSPQSIVHIVVNGRQPLEDATVRESTRHLSPLARVTQAVDGRNRSKTAEEAAAMWASSSIVTSALPSPFSFATPRTPPSQPASGGSLQIAKELPRGWIHQYSNTRERAYYYNLQTGQSTWRRPRAQEHEHSEATSTSFPVPSDGGWAANPQLRASLIEQAFASAGYSQQTDDARPATPEELRLLQQQDMCDMLSGNISNNPTTRHEGSDEQCGASAEAPRTSRAHFRCSPEPESSPISW